MLEVEPRVSRTNIITARERSYASHRRFNNYGKGCTDRGFWHYEGELAPFHGKGLRSIIDDKIAEKPEGINILDVGCGKGIFLGQVVKKHPQIKAFGLSAYDYRGFLSSIARRLERKSKIDYRKGDAHRLASIFTDVNFDLVVSVQLLRYNADPLAVLKQAYRLTKPGGIVMVDKFQRLTGQQADALQRYWALSGIDANLRENPTSLYSDGTYIYALTVQRGESPHLPLPFRYVENPRNFLYRTPYGITYELDEQAA